MIENVNQFLTTVAQTEIARATRRSARAIWNAHRTALRTTRREAGKVIGLAIDEGRKLAAGEVARLSRRVGAAPAHVGAERKHRTTRRAA
jgi:hypothetical protein